MKKKIFISISFILAFICSAFICISQVSLNADGPGNTYELINSVLAPGNDAVENPECVHGAFGRHIAEVWDATLNKYVFEFYSHVTPDNDRCINFDRERVEIKTYSASPANLIGTLDETVVYKWRFKVPQGFQPSSSFTHIHQVKAVGGDEGDPIFTLTPRKGSPNKLELIHVESAVSGSTKLAIVNLSLFENEWVDATETIKIGANGSYSIVVKRVSDGVTILSYSSGNILTIRPDNTFIRPKWGIYRSLNTPSDLRDEALRFSDFSIMELPTPLSAISYYWIGGLGPASFTNNSNWNTQLDGSGDSRNVAGALPTDILIFDGTNVNGDTLTTGSVTATLTSNSIGQLVLQNNASLVLQRATPVPPATAGTGTLTISGDGTLSPDFVIGAGSSLEINSPASDGNIAIALNTGVTGLVSGTVTLSNTGTHRITSQVTNGLVFAAGAVFNSATMPTSNQYAFGSNTQSVQFGTVFQAGSKLIVTGTKSPFGGTSTFQAINMMPGSNFYLRTSNGTGTGSWANLKNYGNLFIENGSTFTADGPFFKIEKLTVNTGCNLITHTSGNTPVLGDLIVDGSLTAPAGSSNTLVMGGNVSQTISGTGTITVPSFTVANSSDVTLLKMITVANTCNIVGKIDFGTVGKITGAATFTSRVGGIATDITGNATEGSYQLTGVAGTLSGNTGLVVKGPGLSSNTNVVGFSTSNAILYLSKPAFITTTGSAYVFSSDSATIITANPNGMDTLNGSVVVTGTKSFQAHTNYVINGPTNWPFGISSSAEVYQTLGNVIINANVTTNYNFYIVNTLQVLSGNFNVRPVDTIRVIAGAGARPSSHSGIFNRANLMTTTGWEDPSTGSTTGKYFQINFLNHGNGSFKKNELTNLADKFLKN